ncbi:hypothetical protein [Kordia sp.]|uniref:hypothetical protein n=1 Tax=Kordia sp. TaxID=1965332 RepID=UPI003B5C39A2
MNTRILIILSFLIFIGCNKQKEFAVPPIHIYINYKDSNNINIPIIKSFTEQYQKAFKDGKIISETRNDTTFFKLYNNDGTLRTDKQTWRYEKRVTASKLNCNEKLSINVERLTFYFCYADVKELITKLSESEDQFQKERYQVIKRELSTIEVKYDANELNFGDSYFLTKLLREIDFEIVDTGNENITEIRIGDVNTGWVVSDELYLLNGQKDTIAAFSNTYLIQ